MDFRRLAVNSGAGTSRRRVSVVVKKTPLRTALPSFAESFARITPRAVLSILAAGTGIALVLIGVHIHSQYVLTLRSPVRIGFQTPLVIARRAKTQAAVQARQDQKNPLTSYQQYACSKFGPACRTALAIQRAENPQGKCEVYHYNADGTLDWGYFQINTVHLKRRGVNLRDLLDCKRNIDFAYQLYVEQQGFRSWSTYKSGAYLKYLR